MPNWIEGNKKSDDAVSREWLETNFQTVCENVICSECPFDDGDCRLIKFIVDAPSVTPNEKEKERTAYKPIRIDGVTEKCPNCGEKVMYSVGTGIMFHGASESYEDWRVIKHYYCPKCGIKIEREEE